MASRLRSATLIALLMVGLFHLPAFAGVFVACWIAQTTDNWSARPQPVTRCRLAGGEVVDYASDSTVPARLHPAVGSTAAGPCWYYTSIPTGLWIVVIYPNGDVDLAAGPTPGEASLVGLYSRCTSEPVAAPDPVTTVWEYVTEYIHDPPTPDLSPSPGDGVTGLETFVSVALPERHTARLTSGIESLDVVIEVATVVVVWGDGTVTSYPAEDAALSGYPDGAARHVYQRKADESRLGVSYIWAARWRPAGGSWTILAVPATTTTVDYPVSEIVAVLRP
jgi:hypothetical protein